MSLINAVESKDVDRLQILQTSTPLSLTVTQSVVEGCSKYHFFHFLTKLKFISSTPFSQSLPVFFLWFQ